ncbi:unnamed protein product [Absidia cylindrospora]
MTDDLSKYALSKSLKRTAPDTSSDQYSPNKKDKRQHTPDANDKQIQKPETEITNAISVLDSTHSTTKDKDIDDNAHSPTQTTTNPLTSNPQDSSPSYLQDYGTTKVAESETSIEKSATPQSQPNEHLDLLEPRPLESTASESQSQSLDTTALTALESSSELEFGAIVENEATGVESGMDQVAVVEHDVGVKTENEKNGPMASEDVHSGVDDNQDMNELQETIPSEQPNKGDSELTSVDDDQTTTAEHDINTTQIEPSATDTANNNNDDGQVDIPATDNGVIIETDQVDATEDTELSGDESKDVLQHDAKEDYLLTPNGEGVSTPVSWGLADTDNAPDVLDEDENKVDQSEVEHVGVDDSGNVDIDASALEDLRENQPKQQSDTRQDENDDLLSTAYSGGDEGNMDVTNNDLDLYGHQTEGTPTIEMEIDDTKERKHDIQNDSATASTTIDEQQSADIAEHDLVTEEKAPAYIVETTPETMDRMDLDQEENGQQAKTTMELELDELDTVISPDAENPDMTSINDNQSPQLAKGTESDVQMDHIATPQDIIDTNITTPQDIDDDKMYISPVAPTDDIVVHKDVEDDDETLSQGIEDEDTMPQEMNKEEHTTLKNVDTDGAALQDMESTDMSPQAATELDVATPLDMIDHGTTTEVADDGKDSTQDKPGDEPTTHTMDDDDVTSQDEHTVDTTNLVATSDDMESTTNESDTKINEQEHDDQGNIADDGAQDETLVNHQHGELGDAAKELETSVEIVEIVEIPVNQESDVVNLEKVSDEIDQQKESNENQTASQDLQDDTQTTDNIDYEEIKSSEVGEQMIDESYQTIDEQVEEDIGDVGDTQNASSPLVPVEVVTEDGEIINKGYATELDEPKTANDDVSDEKVHDNNNEADLDENSGVEDQSDKDSNNGFLDEHGSNDIQDEDTDNHIPVDQHDEKEEQENNEDSSLLDQNNETLLMDADSNESLLDQQDNTDYDDLMEQNTTEIDEQNSNTNDQSAPVTSPAPSPPDKESNNDDSQTEVDGNGTAVAQDLGTDEQVMVDVDHNATLDDAFIISPPSPTSRPDIDQDRKDDDHLMAYEEDETATDVMDATSLTGDDNKDDEAMLEQDDLMEE